MGVGIVIRDEMGLVIAALSKPNMMLHETVSAKATTALNAMEFCRKVGIRNILLEGDSLLVIKAINDPRSNWLHYGQIIEDIKLILGSLRSWTIRHVKRETN